MKFELKCLWYWVFSERLAIDLNKYHARIAFSDYLLCGDSNREIKQALAARYEPKALVLIIVLGMCNVFMLVIR